jgi:hypothetical protein
MRTMLWIVLTCMVSMGLRAADPAVTDSRAMEACADDFVVEVVRPPCEVLIPVPGEEAPEDALDEWYATDPLPDLSLQARDVVVNIFIFGNTVTAVVDATVHNVGNAPAPAAKVKIVVAAGKTKTYVVDLPALAVGHFARVSVADDKLVKNHVTVTVKADPGNRIKELSEKNNKVVVKY